MNRSILRRTVFFIILNFMVLTFSSFNGMAAEEYGFERMWPALQQPWYFDCPIGITVDGQANVYVVDSLNYRIQKFTSSGAFITAWPTQTDHYYAFPAGIAADSEGNVYVTNLEGWIYKFSSSGERLNWRMSGWEGDYRFTELIAIDGQGNVYVVEPGMVRVLKFSSSGAFIAEWGTAGSADGEFDLLSGIATDEQGNVYVVDSGNYRIQKFNSSGEFITAWGGKGGGDGEFTYLPGVIAIDGQGNVYVTDNYATEQGKEPRIQKFSSSGEFMAKWRVVDRTDQSIFPQSIAADKQGNLYVADFLNGQIGKFSSSGTFISTWGSGGSGIGEFDNPSGIAADGRGNFYVADQSNKRIQKFNSSGKAIGILNLPPRFESFKGILAPVIPMAADGQGNLYVGNNNNFGFHEIYKFTSAGSGVFWGGRDVEFSGPYGIATDGEGNVYVADNNQIMKFTSSGEFITAWDTDAHSIAVDGVGNVYVVNSNSDSIRKFSSSGTFITTWDIRNSSKFILPVPSCIATDEEGNVYVGDRDYYIQKFTSSGELIARFGGFGSQLGLLKNPQGLAVGPDGKICVSDSNNNRIQVFKKLTTGSNNKAIVLAGGGAFSGNNLWDSTQMFANFVYRTLTYQGFTKETIYYLTSDTDLDLDSNGVLDDVDGDATNSNLQYAITEWAMGADSVVIYLTDHGGSGTFRMNDSETLSVTDLDAWLNALQAAMPGKVIVVYDACESGSFLPNLIPPAGKERIVLTSTSPREPAKFVTQGSVSFSNYFWTHIFNGLSIKDAFDRTNIALCLSFEDQHPLMDANGNGVGNEAEDYSLTQNMYIGNGTVISGDAPMIGSVSPAQTITGQNFATLYAESVTDDNGIARVWAVIRSPDYIQGSSGNPVTSLPSIDLLPVGEGRYEGTYTAFNITGTYQIAIYAMDRIGNTSVPELTTVSVDSPLRRRAIIVAGGSSSETFWPAVETNAEAAYEALTFQGYDNDDIYFMSPVAFSAGVDGLPTLSNMEYAVTGWAESSTQDLVIYLIGNGDSGTFTLSETQDLSATDLDTWLDSLQKSISGKVTVIYEACRSGSFLPLLTPPSDKERILICSTSDSESAYFLSGGDLSFSKYFWSQVANGSNVRDAFLHGKDAIQYSCKGQTPQMDDNGNGKGNEKTDGILSRNYTIGAGIMLGGDDPIIGSICPAQTLSAGASATLWAKNVTSTNTINKVWAVITPPNFDGSSSGAPITDLPMIELSPVGDDRYEVTYGNFITTGTYTIAIFAVDGKGAVSLPIGTTVTASASDGCLTINSDLSIWVPCAEYDGTGFGFKLNYYPNEDDPSGIYFKMDLSTATSGTGTSCLPIGSDLSMPMSCVSFGGVQYGFTFDFYPNPLDTSGLYWKMDLGTLVVK